MKIRTLYLTLIFFVVITLTGCWDYEEYEDMVQVYAIGIDFNNNTQDITLSLQYIPTTKGEQSGGGQGAGSTPNQIVHTATDKTFFGALTKLQEVIYKKLFYGYLKIIVIGEDAAKHGVLDLIEYLDRTPAYRNSAYILITAGRADTTISTVDAMIKATSSEELHNLVNLSKELGTAYPISIQEFASMLAIPGIEAIAPRIICVSNQNQPEAQGGVEGGIKYDEIRPGDHRLAGVAAFKGDKFAGWLDDKEVLGLGLISGRNVLSYTVSKSSNQADTKDILYYRLWKSKGKIKVKIENGEPVFQVDVKVIADMRKYYSNKGSDFINPKVVQTMEKNLSASIRSDIQATIRKVQKELKTDIFGLGFALFREDSQLWREKYEKKWDKIFPTVPIQVNVDAKVRNTGTNIRRLFVR